MDLVEAIEYLRPTIVQIAVHLPRPPWPARPTPPAALGTGFWINRDGLVITARHVVEGARTLLASSWGSRLILAQAIPSVTSPQLTIRGSFNLIAAEIVEEDQRHDLALVEASPNPFATEHRPFVKTPTPETEVYPLLGLATLSTSEVQDGEPIAVSGYPLAVPALVTTSGSIASAFGTDIQQEQVPGAPPGFTIPNIADSYVADVAVNPGNSGGPVYRVADGGVIGVCVAFRVGQGATAGSIFFYNSGLSVVVPIKYVQDLIARHRELCKTLLKEVKPDCGVE